MDGEENKRLDATGEAAGGTGATGAIEYKRTDKSVSWTIPANDSGPPPPPYTEVELSEMNTRNIDEPKVLCIVQDETSTSLPKYTTSLPQSSAICDLYAEIAKQASYENGTFLLAWRKIDEWGVEVEEILGENSTASLFEMQIPPQPAKNKMYLKEKDSGPPKRLAPAAVDDGNVAKKNAINKASSSATGDTVSNTSNTTSSSWWPSSSQDHFGDADYRGLVNQAMTCYLNSLLQSLFMSPEFRNGLYQCEFQEDRERAVKNIPYQLQKLFLKLQTSKKRAIETTDVTKSFGWDSSEAWQQHDVQELCRVMFDAIEQKLKGTERSDLIKKLYEGHMKDYVKCLECQTESFRHDTFLDVPLSVKPFGASKALESVQEALMKFVEPEILKEDNQYHCERCKRKCDAHKGLKFTHFPKLLTLQLKRFDLDYTTFQRVKLNDKMTFPRILNLNGFVDSDRSPVKVDTSQEEELGTPVDGVPLATPPLVDTVDPPPLVGTSTEEQPPPVVGTSTEEQPPLLVDISTEEQQPLVGTSNEEKPLPVVGTSTEEQPPPLVDTSSEDPPTLVDGDGVVSNTTPREDSGVDMVTAVQCGEVVMETTSEDRCVGDNTVEKSENTPTTTSEKYREGEVDLNGTASDPTKPQCDMQETVNGSRNQEVPSLEVREESSSTKPQPSGEAPNLISPVQEHDANGSSKQVGLPNIMVSCPSSEDVSEGSRGELATASSTNKDQRTESDQMEIEEGLKSGDYVYELFSVMVHSGSALGGHYYAYIKSFSNHQWYCFNDHNVTTTTISEVERAFGGTLSSRGYYSNVYSSSANAYMLMYRQVTEDNESFMEVVDFPEYLKKITEEEERLEEEEKKREQRRKETSSLKLFYHHPQSGTLLYEKVDIHRDDTLRDATDMGYKLLELEKFGVPREQCRIVRYDDYYDLIEKSWDGMDDDPICKVFGGNKRYYPFELFMERKEPSQEFPHYDETEIVIKFHMVDLTRSSSHEAILPIRCIRLLPNKTILELKETIAEVVGLPPDLMRILWEKYHNETIVLDDDTVTLKSAGMHRKTKIFVEGSDEVDFQLPMETCRFKHTVEEYLHLIHVDVYMPEEGVEEKTTNADYSYKSESEKLIEGPPLFVVKIDKRKTLGDLKELLAEKINLEPLFFKIFRVYGNSQEFELYRLEDSLRANPESTKIIIRKGRALQTDEFRVKMFLLDVAQAEHCKELFEIIIGKGQTIGQVKEIILETAKENRVELGFGVEHMRIRRKQWRNPGIIFLDDMVVAKDFQIFLNMEFFVEVLPGPEPMQQSNHIQVYLRRWRPSEMTVGKFEEIILSSSKVANMKKKISDLSGIPAEHVEFAKGHGTFPQDISVLDVDKDLNWSPDCETISSHPLYITTDGCLLYYRDAEEKLKEMSNEEMEELRKKENKRLNKYYSSGYGSSTSTRSWTRKEKALKIYTEDDTVTSTATTTTASDDLGLD